MCGIAGFLHRDGLDADAATVTLKAMADRLVHRGPDNSGLWIDDAAGIALAHRRLAVLDLSAAGHQPMTSASGRYLLSCNGEIYNHVELRKWSECDTWRGHSDMEVLLAAIERWGLQATLRKTVGMYAFALWDRKSRTLSLARDRLGEKPLYYGWQGQSFLFGSQLNALRVHPEFKGQIDRSVLPGYLRNGFIAAPQSVYTGIAKLPPGTVLTVDLSCSPGQVAALQNYWSLHDVVNQRKSFPGTESEAVAALDELLGVAIRRQCVADVPLGAFLSGGTDSSTVVAVMQSQATQPVNTYTIGFEDKAYDEAPYARAVAAHLGTNHNELYVDQRAALAVVPQLSQCYDEPFADASAIPTMLVARMARAQVTVCLSGDGGDELFGGYDRYRSIHRQWQYLRRLPRKCRQALAAGIAVLPYHRRHFLQGSIDATTDLDYYAARTSQWKDPASLLSSRFAGAGSRVAAVVPQAIAEFRERMMYADTLRYLPDDILLKLDRAAMSASLETRVPLLDHRIVEFAWSLPAQLRVARHEPKWLLRQVLAKYVPETLTRRPKKGFGVPLDAWLRGPLRDWAEATLARRELSAQGFFDVDQVHRAWNALQDGHDGLGPPLWIILMFQAWLQQHQADMNAASAVA